MIVDAKNEGAKAFFEHFEFKTCTDAPPALHLPWGPEVRLISAEVLIQACFDNQISLQPTFALGL